MTIRASQVASTVPPRTDGRLNCNNWLSFADKRPISSSTILVSARMDGGKSGFSICTCRIVLIEPRGFFKL